MNNLDAITQKYRHEQTVGPWPCESCGRLSQFADIGTVANHVYCLNENCRFRRTINKRDSRILESDGTVWSYDSAGNKVRVRGSWQ